MLSNTVTKTQLSLCFSVITALYSIIISASRKEEREFKTTCDAIFRIKDLHKKLKEEVKEEKDDMKQLPGTPLKL